MERIRRKRSNGLHGQMAADKNMSGLMNERWKVISGSDVRLPDPDSLISFFEQLRAARYRIDPRQLAAAYRILLSAHLDNWTVDHLQFVLMILFAKTKQEQLDFKEHFDRWLGIREPTKPTRLAHAIARATRGVLITALIVLVVIPAIPVISAFVTQSPLQQSGITPPPGPSGLGPALGAIGSIGLVEAVRASALVPLAIFGTWLLLRWLRLAPWLGARTLIGETLEFDQIDASPAIGHVFRSSALSTTARELRRHRPVASLELDIDRTVESTAQQAGHFSAVWRHRVRRPEYVILIEESGERDHIARILDAAIEVLKKLEVPIRRYYYRGDPRVVANDDPNRSPLSLASLAERERNARLLILGSGRGLINPLNNQLGSRIALALQPWSDKIFLSTEPMEIWGEREHQLLRQGFSVGTASTAGFMSVATRVAQGSSQIGELLEGQLKFSEPVTNEGVISTPSPYLSVAAINDGAPEQRAEKPWQLARDGAHLFPAIAARSSEVSAAVLRRLENAFLTLLRPAMWLASSIEELIKWVVSRFSGPSRLAADDATQSAHRASYLDRVARSVPADLICAWVIAKGLLQTVTPPSDIILWVLLAIFVVITPLLLRITTRASIMQIAVSTTGFVVWVFALGEPFSSLSFYAAEYGSLTVLLFTFMSGVFISDSASKMNPESLEHGPTPDNYLGRMVKYFPTEAIAIWIACSDVVERASGSSILLWIVFGACAISSILLVLLRSRKPWQRLPVQQAVVSAVGFAVWVFATGAPFSSLSFYDPTLASITLLAFCLLSGLIVPDAPDVQYSAKGRAGPR
jgi:hypothetical protein